MKMIAGACSRACLNRSRTRAAPTPTIISTNSAALIEKNGTPASPATALREQRLAGARRADQQHALRRGAAQARVLLGILQEIDDLDQLVLGFVDAGDVVERDPRRPAPGRSGAPCSGRCPSGRRRCRRPAARAPEHPDVERRSAGSPGRSRRAASPSALPRLDRHRADLDAVVDQERLEPGIDERGQRGREGARRARLGAAAGIAATGCRIVLGGVARRLRAAR